MASPYTGDPNAHDLGEFAAGISGTCLCGSIRVTVRDPDLFTRRRGHLCHCINCRKTSGSFVAANLLIEPDKVEITDRDGTMRVYEDYATGSGNVVKRSFCSVDGNPIKSEPAVFPDKVILKIGMFPRIPAPELESFCSHRNPWETSLEGTNKFKTRIGGEKLDK